MHIYRGGGRRVLRKHKGCDLVDDARGHGLREGELLIMGHICQTEEVEAIILCLQEWLQTGRLPRELPTRFLEK